MFTTQHFTKIAHTLNANRADLSLVQDFADMLEETNERFDRVLFIQVSTKELSKDMAQAQRTLDRETGRV